MASTLTYMYMQTTRHPKASVLCQLSAPDFLADIREQHSNEPARTLLPIVVDGDGKRLILNLLQSITCTKSSLLGSPLAPSSPRRVDTDKLK